MKDNPMTRIDGGFTREILYVFMIKNAKPVRNTTPYSEVWDE